MSELAEFQLFPFIYKSAFCSPHSCSAVNIPALHNKETKSRDLTLYYPCDPFPSRNGCIM